MAGEAEGTAQIQEAPKAVSLLLPSTPATGFREGAMHSGQGEDMPDPQASIWGECCLLLTLGTHQGPRTQPLKPVLAFQPSLLEGSPLSPQEKGQAAPCHPWQSGARILDSPEKRNEKPTLFCSATTHVDAGGGDSPLGVCRKSQHQLRYASSNALSGQFQDNLPPAILLT